MKVEYIVVFEQSPNNYSAYPPDLSGCISAAPTWEGIQEMVREAIAVYIHEALKKGSPFPEPRMSVEEAMTFHSNALAEYAEEIRAEFADALPTLATTFAPVEVEVTVPVRLASGA